MSIHSTTPPFGDRLGLPTNDGLGRVFADARRRALVRALTACDGVVELDELTARVVEVERGDPGGKELGSGDEYADRVLVSLYRRHLPVLADVGLVEVEERDGVFVRPDTDALGELS